MLADQTLPKQLRYYAHFDWLIINEFAFDKIERSETPQAAGREVVRRMDVAATAGGVHRAVDLVFNGVRPHQGVIELRFQGGLPQKEGPGRSGEAFVQAIEVGPGDGGQGAIPVR